MCSFAQVKLRAQSSGRWALRARAVCCSRPFQKANQKDLYGSTPDPWLSVRHLTSADGRTGGASSKPKETGKHSAEDRAGKPTHVPLVGVVPPACGLRRFRDREAGAPERCKTRDLVLPPRCGGLPPHRSWVAGTHDNLWGMRRQRQISEKRTQYCPPVITRATGFSRTLMQRGVYRADSFCAGQVPAGVL